MRITTTVQLLSLGCISMFPASLSLSLDGPRKSFGRFCTATTAGASFVFIAIIMSPPPVDAACFPGDLSKECIGVYKEYGDVSPESLEKSSPGMKYVEPRAPPKTVDSAISILRAQRKASDDIKQDIAAGHLEEAGIKVLKLVPKLVAAGETILTAVMQQDTGSNGINELRRTRVEQDLDQLVVLYKQLDVSIGQGLRGQMGVSAAAQLQILDALEDATVAFDDFLLSTTAYN